MTTCSLWFAPRPQVMGEITLLDTHLAINSYFNWGQMLLKCHLGEIWVMCWVHVSEQRGIVLLCWMYRKLRISAKRCCNGEIAIYQSFYLKCFETLIFSWIISVLHSQKLLLLKCFGWFYPTLLPHCRWHSFSRKLYTFSVLYFCARHKVVSSILMKGSVVSVPRLLVISSNMLFGAVFKYLHNSLFIIVLWKNKLWRLPCWNIYPSRAVSCRIAVGLGFWCWAFLQEENCSLSWSIQPWSVTWTLWRGLWLVHVVEGK